MTTDEQTVREIVRRVVLRTLGPDGIAAQPGTGNPVAAPAGRPTITEADVTAIPAGGKLCVPPGALVTPLAVDTALDRGVELVWETAGGPSTAAGKALHAGPDAGTTPGRTVAMAADHGGFALKEELKAYVAELGFQVIDCGTSGTQAVDYPDFAYAAARLVAEGRAARAIIVDGAGIGSCMVANKVPGVRAAMCHDHATAVNSREHNDANVLTLGGSLIGPNLARQIVKAWLETPFGGGRHARRVDKITAVERRFLRS